MRTVGLVLAFAVAALPLGAHAAPQLNCGSAPECLQRLGLGRVDWKVAAVLGAAAAPAVVVGAFLTAARAGAAEKAAPDGVVVTEDASGKPHAELQLVPTKLDPYYNQSPPERPSKRNDGAFHFNDTATNIALAVGGAAILTSIVAGIVKGTHH